MTVQINAATTLHFASLRCGWCREHGPPEWKSGYDRVGGWVAGWTHDAGDGKRAICAAASFWPIPEQA